MNKTEAELTTKLNRSNTLVKFALSNGRLLQSLSAYVGKHLFVLSNEYENVKRFAAVLSFINEAKLYEATLTDKELGSQLSEISENSIVLLNTTDGSSKKAVKSVLEAASSNKLFFILYAETPETLISEFTNIEGVSFNFSVFADCTYIDEALKEVPFTEEVSSTADEPKPAFYIDDKGEIYIDGVLVPYDPDYDPDEYDERFDGPAEYDDDNEDDESLYEVSYCGYDEEVERSHREQEEQQRRFARQQEKFQEEQNRIAREAAKAPIIAQIAALKAELGKQKAIYMQKNGMKLNLVDRQGIDALERQIKDLEEQLWRM